ncbi:MAG: carbohydrate ABC transporter substrate-binding protein [Clostridium butyricum]|nr:carbohydrate ABC transporter substrate-binding protein [Clostridium butyricum]
MYKKIISIFICLFVTLNLSACSSSNTSTPKDQVTIRFSWWGGESRHDKTIKAIEAFQNSYPNIKVKVEFAEWTGFKKKMNMRIAGNNEPDLMQINYDWLQSYSPDGKGFYDLNKVSDTLELNNFSSEILNYGTKNGILNAIPISMNGKVIFYNKTLADKYGLDNFTTWDSLLSSKNKISDGNYVFELDLLNAWFLGMTYIYDKTGKDFINSDMSLGYDQNDIKNLLSFYKSLIDNNIIPQPNSIKTYNLSSNSAVANISWASQASKMDAGVKKINSELTVGPMPSSTGANPISFVKPSMLFAISKNTDHPNEAALLMNFLLNNPDGVNALGLDRGVPCSKSAIDTLKENNQLSGIQCTAINEISQCKNILVNPYCENTLIKEICNEALTEVSYGQSSVDNIAEKTYYNLYQTLNTLK